MSEDNDTNAAESFREAANGHKRAILYTRVSTDEQAEHGYSLQSQLEACRAYAERHNPSSHPVHQECGAHSASVARRTTTDQRSDSTHTC